MSSVLQTVAVHHGLGQHIWKLQPDRAVTALRYSWIAQAFSVSTVAIGKTSIALFLLLRIVGAAKWLWHKIFLYTIMISNIVINLVVIVLVFAQCKPVQKLFDPGVPGHCWNPEITTAYAQFGGGA